jgi:hypothetical protein
MTKEEIIRVKSSVSPGNYQPVVVQTYGDNVVTMSAEVARDRAIAIFQAIAYADSEGVIFKTFAPAIAKGFGKPSKDMQVVLDMVRLIRQNRHPLPQGINAIFGFNTQQPLVDLEWDDIKISLRLDEALHHATCLLEVAEAAQSDSFLYQFCINNFDCSFEQVAILIQEFALHRQRTQLEAIADK